MNKAVKAPITIRYEHPHSGKLMEKTFTSQEAMEKWAKKSEVKITAYSTN